MLISSKKGIAPSIRVKRIAALKKIAKLAARKSNRTIVFSLKLNFKKKFTQD